MIRNILYDSFEDKNKKEALVAYFFSHPNLRAPEAHWNEKKKSFEAVDPRYGKGFVGSN